MEKSIEKIWAEGFLANDALVAPKINNLYDRKSIHIIEKFTRMFKINLIAIVVFSLTFLIISYFVGIPITGIIFFVMLSVLVVINARLFKGLKEIKYSMNSYEYLMSFNTWMTEQRAVNRKISTFLYPIVFVALVLGFWFNDAEGVFLGERLVSDILLEFPDIPLLFGVPIIGIIIGSCILVILAFFGGRLYEFDLKIVYGRLLKKLEDLLLDLKYLNE